jgi:hypothetical protein
MGVSVNPGLITFARMPRLASSAVQVQTNETKAAFVAEYGPKPGTPMCHAADPGRMIDDLSASSGTAFCTVKYAPRVQVDVSLNVSHHFIEAIKIIRIREISPNGHYIFLDQRYRRIQLSLTSFTKRLAVARPIPLLPPVITATFPWSALSSERLWSALFRTHVVDVRQNAWDSRSRTPTELGASRECIDGTTDEL